MNTITVRGVIRLSRSIPPFLVGSDNSYGWRREVWAFLPFLSGPLFKFLYLPLLHAIDATLLMNPGPISQQRKDPGLYHEFLAEREEILRHKWLESEKAGEDIGFERALLDWLNKHRMTWSRGRGAVITRLPELVDA